MQMTRGSGRCWSRPPLPNWDAGCGARSSSGCCAATAFAGSRRACARGLDTVLDELASSPPVSPPTMPGSPASNVPPAEGAAPSGLGDVAILRSAPGVGTLVSAILLAEASPLLTARDYEG